jgi:SAM-dependent methyltransferase
VDLIISIEAISHYHDVPGFLDECERVLRPGGWLLISDGNNGANASIRAETEELWERLEVGPKGPCMSHEITETMVDRRERMIRARFPEIGPEQVHRMAEATSGMVKAEVENAVAAHLAGGPAPDSYYKRGTCPREPEWGHWIEWLFDPHELGRDIARRGFEVRLVPHYGGARNDMVLAANMILLQFPSFRFARAFRIAARKRS